MPLPSAGPLNYSKAGNRERATCSATLLQNELNSDVPRFATCVQTCFATNKVVRVFFVSDKRRKIAIQLVLQQSRKTAISKKVLGKTVHTTIPKGIMGYDQCTFRDTVAVESTFVAFL